MSAQLMQIVVYGHDLFCGIGRAGLLSVAEGGICDPDLLRHMMGDDSVIERDLGDLRTDFGTYSDAPHPPAGTYVLLAAADWYVCQNEPLCYYPSLSPHFVLLYTIM